MEGETSTQETWADEVEGIGSGIGARGGEASGEGVGLVNLDKVISPSLNRRGERVAVVSVLGGFT